MTPVETYYAVVSILSFVLTMVFLFRWHKHFDVHISLAFVLIPIVNLAFFMMYASRSTDAAMIALKIIYLGSCFLPWLITMSIAGLCQIPINRTWRMATYLMSAIVYGGVLSIGHHPYFYKSVTFVDGVLVKEYGPGHTIHYVVIVIYLLIDLTMLTYTYRRKKQVSRRVLFLLFVPIPGNVAAYIVNYYTMQTGLEVLPLTYLLAQIIYLFIVHRMVVYNVNEMVVETVSESGNTGFITVDFKNRYLGSNETAREILPDLAGLAVDGPVGRTAVLNETVVAWIDRFKEDPDHPLQLHYYRIAEQGGEEGIYAVSVNYLYDGRMRRGYQIFLTDDTQNQKYISLLDQYNIDLQKDVEAKTEQIVAMHDQLILGMASMVESRDNSTGGHIRRTSVGVRLLIEQMRADETLALTDSFCDKIIKAAPMHDLGKIAVDDAVLKKNGPFTPEERLKMQRHAAEGARIVQNILADTDDEEFAEIAENVAHYHHERVDGTGYPDGLKGDAIPLEARIMAIADVYDALVSKRVYKEKFSFEKANEIILEGMGTQFDAALRPYYEKARPHLETFYATQK